jgi:hypothetical protein
VILIINLYIKKVAIKEINPQIIKKLLKVAELEIQKIVNKKIIRKLLMTKIQKNIIFINYNILNNNEFFTILTIAFNLWPQAF